MDEMNARRIKAWLILHGIKQSDIARKLGLSRVMIRRFITGHSSSVRVFNYFMQLGCPRKYFVGRPETKRAA